MVGINYDMKVDEHTMKWLKNGGRDLLINTSIEVSTRLINRKVMGGFEMSIFYEGERMCEVEDMCYIGDELDEDGMLNLVTVPKGMIQYSADWYGHEEASVIFHILSEICEKHGVQDVTEGSMQMGLVSLDIGNKILGNGKLVEPFLIANDGNGVNLRKYLEESEIPKQ